MLAFCRQHCNSPVLGVLISQSAVGSSAQVWLFKGPSEVPKPGVWSPGGLQLILYLPLSLGNHGLLLTRSEVRR